jgi:hypothetical protein
MRSFFWQDPSWMMINWAPVLTLWGTVVAGVLGFGHDEAPALGRVLQAKKPLDI